VAGAARDDPPPSVFTAVKITYAAVNMREQLGAEIKRARTERGLTLEAASRAAKISQGYLHKLEAGAVENPSPRVLHRLSEVVGVSYRRLMELADYLLPESKETVTMAAKNPTSAPTNAELWRLLEAVRAELEDIRASQLQMVRILQEAKIAG
jgi:transcriptional regulator with XRE-family HTH domain